MTLKTSTAIIVSMLLCYPTLQAGLGKKEARYMGGTLTGIPQDQECKFDVSSNESVAKFVCKKSSAEIAYDKITSLEYGQKAGRRVGATIGWGVTTLGIAALPLLFSKKRKHYLTIGFTGQDGKSGGAVIELGKNVVRGTLVTLEARSGQEIEYESEEARKHAGN